jgi:hypothetical protein
LSLTPFDNGSAEAVGAELMLALQVGMNRFDVLFGKRFHREVAVGCRTRFARVT